MNKLIKLHIFTIAALALASNAAFAMEEEQKSTIPNYTTFDGKEISERTIGQLALELRFPEKETKDIIGFRDENKELLAHLMDFSQEHSQYREVRRKNVERIKASGLDYVGNASYIFALPNNRDLFVEISGHLYRSLNCAEHKGSDTYNKFWTKEGLTPEEFNSCPKVPTKQTISRALGFWFWLKVAKEHNFKHFSVPEVCLMPLDDNQTEECDDDRFFAVQRRAPKGYVLVADNKEKLNTVKREAFDEVLTAIAPARLWDIYSNLYINDNGDFMMLNLQHGSNNPASVVQTPYLDNHLALCGFEGIYKLCSENPELQEVVQKFAQNNVRLADNDRLEAQKTRLLEVVGLSK